MTFKLSSNRSSYSELSILVPLWLSKIRINHRFDRGHSDQFFALSREARRMATVHKDQFQSIEDKEFLSFYERNTRTAEHDFCIRCTTYTFHYEHMTPGFCNINAHWSDDPAIASVFSIYSDGVGVSLEVSS